MSDASSKPTVHASPQPIIEAPTVIQTPIVEQKIITIEEVVDPTTKELTYCFECPHCGGEIQVPKSWIACTIFRHAIYKGQPGNLFNPHASKEMCDKALADGIIYGCGKPFKFNGNLVEKCDYI